MSLWTRVNLTPSQLVTVERASSKAKPVYLIRFIVSWGKKKQYTFRGKKTMQFLGGLYKKKLVLFLLLFKVTFLVYYGQIFLESIHFSLNYGSRSKIRQKIAKKTLLPHFLTFLLCFLWSPWLISLNLVVLLLYWTITHAILKKNKSDPIFFNFIVFFYPEF